MSDDRKYRHRGYRDEPREPRREQGPAPKKEYAPRGQPPVAPKTFNMPGFREVVRCARCGNELTVAAAWSPDGQHIVFLSNRDLDDPNEGVEGRWNVWVMDANGGNQRPLNIDLPITYTFVAEQMLDWGR